MKLIIDEELRKKYPELRMTIITAKLSYNNSTNEIDNIITNKFNDFINKNSDLDNLLNNNSIIEWRETYKSFGINPKKKKPSAEALLTRVIKNNYIPHINPAVDAYLASETIHCLPIGGYDLEKINGNIYLGISKGEEPFIAIKNDDVELTKPGEVVYRDDERILTRCWNYKDCMHSQINNDTRQIALFVEAPSKNITNEMIIETAKDIEQNLKEFCQANTQMMFIDENLNEIEIKL